MESQLTIGLTYYRAGEPVEVVEARTFAWIE